MAVETARGQRITIHFDPARCVHSRNCVLGNPKVFVPNAEGEWLHPDAAPPDEVEAIVRSCPSGALTFERADVPGEQAPDVNTVRVRENGPLAFHAECTVAGAVQPFRTTLCRCGLSHNKPFCDNRHREGGFVATGEPAERPSQPLAARNGMLAVEPTRDGPLHVTGNLEVVSGTGHTVNRVTETWLCRCGRSNNKPYCDGSHRKAGFRADGA
ncbi:MAG TPA: CDGSH iron-sulfur domain-containing protein [Xanthomonadaceae bacterium]|nr:CDGSH iron-sulfur domain-containing protein [Xanthomonadaceae bacterium]